MTDSRDDDKNDEPEKRLPPPKAIKFYDPWEEEFRRSYKDDKSFDF